MASNFLLNVLGEIMNVADIVGGDFPAASTVSLGPLGSYTPPSATPTGQNYATVLNLGNAATNEIYSTNTEFWSGSPGILSMPLLPVSANSTDACQVLYVNRNNQNIGIAYRDARNLTNAGTLQPGETAVYAPGSTGRLKLDINGNATLGTTASTGAASGSGAYIQVSNTGGIYLVSPFGTLSIDENGINLNSATGSSISLGGMAGLPGPFASLSSVINMNAAAVNIGQLVNLGMGPVFAQAVCPVSPYMPPGVPIPMFASIASQSVYVSVT